MPSGEKRFQWPDRQCWIAFLLHGVWLTLLWLIVYGGASWVTSLHAYRVRLHLDAELQIPFVPAAAVVYLSLFPFMWLAPLALKTAPRVHAFAKSIASLVLISGVGFLLLPADAVHEPPQPTGILGQVFVLADVINLSHNYLPSLHVGMAVVAALLYSQAASSRSWVLVYWVWAVAIIVSTVLLHQHYLADVVTGALLGWLVVRFTR